MAIPLLKRQLCNRIWIQHFFSYIFWVFQSLPQFQFHLFYFSPFTPSLKWKIHDKSFSSSLIFLSILVECVCVCYLDCRSRFVKNISKGLHYHSKSRIFIIIFFFNTTQWRFQEFCPGCSYFTLKKFQVIFGLFRMFRNISVNTGRNSRWCMSRGCRATGLKQLLKLDGSVELALMKSTSSAWILDKLGCLQHLILKLHLLKY